MGKIRKLTGPLNIRFFSNSTAMGHLSFSLDKKKFEPVMSGLVANESFGGCCLVFTNVTNIESGQKCLVQYGDFYPILAEVRWVKKLDDTVTKIGLEFLE